MGFRFPLATLLRLREITEQREERLLGQILNQIVASRQTLAELETQRRSLRMQRDLALQQTTSAFQILGFDAQMGHIDDLEVAGREHLAKLATLREHQISIYETAHRDRELLSGMKHERQELFQAEQVRQEQRVMDDNFASRKRFS